MKKNLQSLIFYHYLSFLYDQLISWNGYKKGLTHFIQSLSFPNQPLKTLDAGCGTGLISFALTEKYPNMSITAFDYSAKMIQAAEKINNKYNFQNVRFYIGDIENINPLVDLKSNKEMLEANVFDLIFVAGALEYTNLAKGIKELCSLLKAGGTIYNIAVKNNWRGRLLGQLMGFKPYSKTEMIATLQKTGFSKITVIPFQGKEEQKASNLKVVVKAIKCQKGIVKRLG